MGFDVAGARAFQRERVERDLLEREERRIAALVAARTAVLAVAPHFPTVSRVFIFGSVTRPGAFRLSSDIDIAVEGTLSAEAYFRLWREIEDLLTGWEVDLVELNGGVRFVERVRANGESIYERGDPFVEGGHQA